VQNVNWGCRKEEEGGWFESQQHPPDQRTSPIVSFVSSVAPSLFSVFYLFVFPSSSLQPFLLFSGISSRAISVAVVSSLHSSLSVFASYSASLLWARGSRQPNLHPRRVRRSWQLFSAAPFAIMTTASNAACIFFLLLSKTPKFDFSGFCVCVVHENMKLWTLPSRLLFCPSTVLHQNWDSQRF
jgi:hypothetical protein